MSRPFEIQCPECQEWHDGDLVDCPACGRQHSSHEDVMARGGGLDRWPAIIFAEPKGYG